MIKLVQRETLSCEAIVRRVPNGELLMVCQCGDITEPASGNRVYVWHSKDDGNTWLERTLIKEDDGRAVYQTEVSVIDDEIRVYMTFHNGKFCENEHTVFSSLDNGYTWNDIGSLPHLNGFYFVRGLYREGNTHFLPYQLYDVDKKKSAELSAQSKALYQSDTEYCVSGVLISHDNGKNYKRCSKDALLPMFNSNGRNWVWSEPSLCRLQDSRLAMLLRADCSCYLFITYSSDEGMTWTEPVITDIPNPSNKVKLINMPDGRIALIHTPNNSRCGLINRNPLSLWITDDDMKTWRYKRVLVDYDGCFSYPDGFIENGTLYLSYDFNRHDVYFMKYTIE